MEIPFLTRGIFIKVISAQSTQNLVMSLSSVITIPISMFIAAKHEMPHYIIPALIELDEQLPYILAPFIFCFMRTALLNFNLNN